MAARQSAPVLGAPADDTGPGKWDIGFTWRWQKSDRHYTGIHNNVNRQTEHSEVINDIHLIDLSITRNYTPRWSLTLGIPYLMAERSQAIRDANGEVVGRNITQARGLGDVTASVRHWIFDPVKHTKGNTSVGLGFKVPTGENNVYDSRQRVVDGPVVTQTVDQSIQPGDGGFGIVLDVQSYYRFAKDRLAGYGTLTYLFNPEGTSGVRTFRGDPGEEIMSIADQYLARAGIAWYPGKGWGVSAGYRIEGVPVYDAFGSSEGFRRPGYAVSIEPAVSWRRGPHTLGLSVPFATVRNRQRSVADRENNDAGDAAFADYIIIASYSRRF